MVTYVNYLDCFRGAVVKQLTNLSSSARFMASDN